MYHTSAANSVIVIVDGTTRYNTGNNPGRSLTFTSISGGPWWRHQMETLSASLAFVRDRSPVNSPHKGQWLGALIFSLICVWINDWVNNREAGDLRRYRAHFDVTLMLHDLSWFMLLAIGVPGFVIWWHPHVHMSSLSDISLHFAWIIRVDQDPVVLRIMQIEMSWFQFNLDIQNGVICVILSSILTHESAFC